MRPLVVRLRTARALLAAVSWGLALGLSAHTAGQEDRPAERIDRIFVPADKPQEWPEGDWRPFPRDRFEKLLNRDNSQDRPLERPQIERAEYSAVFSDGAFRSGRLSWKVAYSGQQPDLLTLAPLNLAIGPELKWSDQIPAIWGTASDGFTKLHVPAGGQVAGTWVLAGRQFSASTEFAIEIPESQISQFKLTLPDNRALRSSAGIVDGPYPTRRPGWHEWRIDLGGESALGISVTPVGEKSATPPSILAAHDTAYLIHEGGVTIRTDFDIEVLGAPLKQLTFSLPPDVEVHQVNYGAELPLSWTTTSADQGRAIRVDLPDPLIGRGRAIRIQANTPLASDSAQELPQIVLQGAAFEGGRLTLDVRRPLELKAFTPLGCRQVATSFDLPGRETFTFEQFVADAWLNVEVAYPRLDLAAQQVSLLTIEPRSRALQAEIEWRALSGSPYEVSCAIPDGWEIVEIAGPPDSKLADWELRQEGRPRLALEFLTALDATHPKRVRISARQLFEDRASTLPLPIIEPLECASTGVVVGVFHPESAVPSLTLDSSFEPVVAGNLPAVLEDSAIWKAISAAPDATSVFASSAPSPAGKLTIDDAEAAIDAQAQVLLQISSQSVHEAFRLRIRPRIGPIARVFAFLTAPGEPIEWKLHADHLEVAIPAQRAQLARHPEFGLPATGELWELQLPPQSTEFVIAGARLQPVTAQIEPALLLAPEAGEFRGVLEWQSDEGLGIEVETAAEPTTSGAESPSQRDPVPSGLAANRRQYERAQDAPTLRVDLQNAAAKLRNPAFLKLQTLISADEGGYDVHRATFELLQPCRSRFFRFQLDEPAELIGVRLNGRTIALTRRDRDYELPELPELPTNEIEIHYRSPSTTAALRESKHVIAPRSSWDVLNFDWEVALPPHLALLQPPDGMRLTRPLVELGWAERLLGPLGRRASASPFNPLSLRSWQTALAEPSRTPSSDQAADAFAPQAWTRIRATAPQIPAGQLALDLLHQSRAQGIGWLAVSVCLVAAVALRLLKGSGSSRLLVAGLCASFAAAVLAPPEFSPLCGGSFAAILLATLLPTSWLQARRASELDAKVPTGSTLHFPAPAQATVLIAAVALGTQALAQQELAGPSAVIPDDRLAVLIPASQDQPASPLPVVYVTPALLNWLNQLESGTSPATDYLILAADYETAIDGAGPPLIEARYAVSLLQPDRAVRAFFPITSVHLAGADAIQVDGQPHALSRAADGSGFYLDLPGKSSSAATPRTMPVSLKFYPASAAPQRTFDVDIPAVAASRLTLHTPEPLGPIVGPGLRLEEPAALASDAAATFQFGRTNKLRVDWTKSAVVTQSAELTAQVLQRVEVTPHGLDYHVQAVYQPLRGTVDRVAWLIPDGFIVRSVVAGDNMAGHSLLSAAGSQTRLQVEFAQPQSQEFSVAVDLTLPLANTREVLRVPAPTFIANLPNSGVTVSSTLNHIGVSTTSEFELGALTTDSAGVTSIAVESFGRPQDSEASNLAKPQFAYQVREPGELLFHIDSRLPNREVRVTQEFTVDVDAVRCVTSAEISVDSAAAFQHVLIVDPALKIQSVSVREGGAERLARWRHDGNRVTLFLKDKTVGIQSVLLRGLLSTELSIPQTLPIIEFEDAATTESTLLLYRSPAVNVEVLQTEALRPGDVAALPPLTGSTAIGVAAYELLPSALLPQIIVSRPQRSPEFESFTALQAAGTPGRWNASSKLVLRDAQGESASLTVVIAPEFAQSFRVIGYAAEPVTEVRDDGSLDLYLQPALLSETTTIAATGSLVEPSAGEWSLPVIALDEPIAGRAWLAIAPAQRWKALDTAGGELVDPVKHAGFADLLPPAGDAQAIMFESVSSAWKLVRVISEAASTAPQISRVRTYIWQPDDTIFGRTEIESSTASTRTLAVSWPAGVSLRAALLNGVPVPVDAATSSGLTVSLGTSAAPGSRLALYWMRESAEPLPLLGTWKCDVPVVQNALVDDASVVLVPPRKSQLKPRGSWQRIPESDRQASHSGSQATADVDDELLQMQSTMPQASTATAWIADERLTSWPLAVLILAIGCLILLKLLRPAALVWLQARPLAALATIGLAWWLCCAWSPGGLLAFVTAALLAAREFWFAPADDEFVATAFMARSSSIHE